MIFDSDDQTYYEVIGYGGLNIFSSYGISHTCFIFSFVKVASGLGNDTIRFDNFSRAFAAIGRRVPGARKKNRSASYTNEKEQICLIAKNGCPEPSFP